MPTLKQALQSFATREPKRSSDQECTQARPPPRERRMGERSGPEANPKVARSPNPDVSSQHN
eukprot:525345-Amphidinium_carterae.1